MPDLNDAWLELPYAHGGHCGSGRLRVEDADFQVDENLGYEPDGDGEHVMIHIRKRAMNTDQVARALARLADVPARDVSYAGMKDRNAVTTQWFSVGLAGRPEPDWSPLNDDRLAVLASARHRRKLRRGDLEGNRFRLRIRDLDVDRQCLAARLAAIAAQGVPNYFGDQRFGRDGGNLDKAEAMLLHGQRERDRHLRGLYMSAARSFLFNRVLARRVAEGSWNQLLSGELVTMDDMDFIFDLDPDEPGLARRLAAFEIHPSGPLWGRGRLRTKDEALAVETAALADWQEWRDGLEHVGLDQDRRALRISPRGFAWEWEGDDLMLAFSLPAGAYATALLRELIESREADRD